MLQTIDIAALRKADTILIYSTFGTLSQDADGGRIVARKDANNVLPFGAEHQVGDLQVRLTQYGRGAGTEAVSAFTRIGKYTPEWASFAALLRRGDEIELHWIAGNSSELLREKGLTVDELDVCIRRGKDRSQLLTFAMGYMVAGERSPGRMIRHDPVSVRA